MFLSFGTNLYFINGLHFMCTKFGFFWLPFLRKKKKIFLSNETKLLELKISISKSYELVIEICIILFTFIHVSQSIRYPLSGERNWSVTFIMGILYNPFYSNKQFTQRSLTKRSILQNKCHNLEIESIKRGHRSVIIFTNIQFIIHTFPLIFQLSNLIPPY